MTQKCNCAMSKGHIEDQIWWMCTVEPTPWQPRIQDAVNLLSWNGVLISSCDASCVVYFWRGFLIISPQFALNSEFHNRKLGINFSVASSCLSSPKIVFTNFSPTFLLDIAFDFCFLGASLSTQVPVNSSLLSFFDWCGDEVKDSLKTCFVGMCTYMFAMPNSIFKVEICCAISARNLTTSSFFDICHWTFLATRFTALSLFATTTPKLRLNFTVCWEKASIHLWQSSTVLCVAWNIAFQRFLESIEFTADFLVLRSWSYAPIQSGCAFPHYVDDSNDVADTADSYSHRRFWGYHVV